MFSDTRPSDPQVLLHSAISDLKFNRVVYNVVIHVLVVPSFRQDCVMSLALCGSGHYQIFITYLFDIDDLALLDNEVQQGPTKRLKSLMSDGSDPNESESLCIYS